MKKITKKSKKRIKEELNKINKLINIICNAIGLAMGVGVIVLYILKELNINDAIIMLGVGVLCVSIPVIMKRN